MSGVPEDGWYDHGFIKESCHYNRTDPSIGAHKFGDYEEITTRTDIQSGMHLEVDDDYSRSWIVR